MKIRTIAIVSMIAVLAGCDNGSATLDTNAYYAEQGQPLMQAPTVDDFPPVNNVQEVVQQPVQQAPVVIHQSEDEGFDWGAAAIGFVAAEIVDDVFDSGKKNYIAPTQAPIINKVTPYQTKTAPVIKKVAPVKPVEVKKVEQKKSTELKNKKPTTVKKVEKPKKVLSKPKPKKKSGGFKMKFGKKRR